MCSGCKINRHSDILTLHIAECRRTIHELFETETCPRGTERGGCQVLLECTMETVANGKPAEIVYNDHSQWPLQ